MEGEASLNGGEMGDARCGLHQPDSFVAEQLNLRISFNSRSRSVDFKKQQENSSIHFNRVC